MSLPTQAELFAEIRNFRALKWKRGYCQEHELYKRAGCVNVEDLARAPEPTDADIGFPIETLTVEWGSGCLMVELAALAKMPAAQRNKIYKLGGL